MALNSMEITYMIETGFAYLRNMLAKVEVTVKDKQFNWKMADDPISLLFSANNNKVCFIWIKL